MKKKPYIIIAIAAVNVLLLAIIGALALRCGSISGTLITQHAADRWAGERDEHFAQVSCFYPLGQEKTETEIRAFRDTLEKKLGDAGVEAPEKGSYWTDAYAAISNAQTKGERGSSEATLIGVGGDFFLFHPYELLSGSYISDDDLMSDRVVIDKELAWKLYGGTDLSGMTMVVNGKVCYIAGVVEREADKYSQRCFSDKPLVFMHCSEAGADGEAAMVTCYEMAMIDPISGFALKTVTEGMANDKVAVFENSARYSFTSIFNIFKNFGARSIQTKAVAYPYWENAARITEVYIARLYVIMAALAVLPLLCAIALLIKLIRLFISAFNRGKAKAKEAWDDRYGRREARREKKAAKKAAAADGEAPKKKRLRKPKTKAKTKKKPKPVSGKTELRTEESLMSDEVLADVESIVNEVLGEARNDI